MIVISKKIGLYTFLVSILAILIYLFVYYLSVTDATNIRLEGYVFDEETKQPINKVMIIINNERYEDNKGNKNYDEYLGHDKIKLYSDKNGYYATIINKSAFLWLDFNKEGYLDVEEKGQYSEKKMEYKTFMKKN
ncbi:hypothetical protein [Flavobacterium humi]|uniref:Carboxypeptidase regulatory-like domain-containing protein n=1 Tax=Flavobacterium humi TaxID=2562683 RepID=A0A4Z0LDE5_9FLAO|nr:hypothetical protein [Flavobacterium humi]TGD59897.1 hypothetical protein E4635_02905 [Flavobacterium humi]